MINGPWRFDGVNVWSPYPFASNVCHILGDRKYRAENGRAIAALPDLLEALESLVDRHRAFCTSPDWNGDDDVEQALAQAAILKAKGN